MKVRFFNPGLSYSKIKSEVDSEMQRVLAKGDLILREDVEKFEQNLAKYLGTKYAVGVASGTDALILSLKAMGIGAGDEVILPGYTFRATAEAVHHIGATPVIADLGEDWTVRQTWKTKAIVPAHIAGETLDWVPDDDITMVEDACQAIGAKPLTGIAACYSFYPAKILGCYGDGGAIATNDESLYEELKIMRNHYKGDWKPYGYNSRLDNLQAAVLNVKLKYLPADLLRRKQIALMYDRDLIGVGLPKVRDVYQDYIISYEDRDGLKNWLTSQGIETMENGYPFPAGLYKGKRAEKYESESLRIPCNPDLTDEEVNYVIEKINEYTQK